MSFMYSDNELIIKFLFVKMKKYHQSYKALNGHILLFIEQYFLGKIKGLE